MSDHPQCTICVDVKLESSFTVLRGIMLQSLQKRSGFSLNFSFIWMNHPPIKRKKLEKALEGVGELEGVTH